MSAIRIYYKVWDFFRAYYSTCCIFLQSQFNHSPLIGGQSDGAKVNDDAVGRIDGCCRCWYSSFINSVRHNHLKFEIWIHAILHHLLQG